MTKGQGPGENEPVLFGVYVEHVGNGAQDPANYRVNPVATFEIPENGANQTAAINAEGTAEKVPLLAAPIQSAAPFVLRALDTFARRNKKLGLLEGAATKAHGKRIEKDLGADKEGILEDAAFQKDRLLQEARTNFTQAFNIGLIEKHDENSTEVREAFVAFYRKYGLKEKEVIKRRDRVRAGLQKHRAGKPFRKTTAIKRLQETFDDKYLDITMPMIAAYKPKTEELPQLKTIAERFGAIMEASDAGYRSGSKIETSRGLMLLAELGAHGSRAFGHRNFSAALVRNKNNLKDAGYGKETQKWGRNRVFISLMYEAGDYLYSARRSQEALEWLKNSVGEDANPNLSLSKVIQSNDVRQQFAVATLARHLTLEWLEQGVVSEGWFKQRYGFRPLTHVEDRKHTVPKLPVTDKEFADATTEGAPYAYFKDSFARFKSYIERRIGKHPDFTQKALMRKNKTVYDPFSDPNKPEEVKDYIARMAEVITIGDIRTGLLAEAVSREQKREVFYVRTLNSILGEKSTLFNSVKERILNGHAV